MKYVIKATKVLLTLESQVFVSTFQIKLIEKTILHWMLCQFPIKIGKYWNISNIFFKMV